MYSSFIYLLIMFMPMCLCECLHISAGAHGDLISGELESQVAHNVWVLEAGPLQEEDQLVLPAEHLSNLGNVFFKDLSKPSVALTFLPHVNAAAMLTYNQSSYKPG